MGKLFLVGLLALAGTEMNNPYSDRDLYLHQLGYVDYAQYLRSGLWKSIRARVKGECLRCGRPRTCVHHASYDLETLKGERIDTLVPACQGCHRKAEKEGRKHGDPAERLNAVTAMLMTRWSKPSKTRRRRRHDNAEMTWRWDRKTHAAPVSKKMLEIRTWTRKVAPKVAFDPTPRLVRPAG